MYGSYKAIRECSIFMPQVGPEKIYLFQYFYVLPNLVHFKNNSHPTNTES